MLIQTNISVSKIENSVDPWSKNKIKYRLLKTNVSNFAQNLTQGIIKAKEFKDINWHQTREKAERPLATNISKH